MGCDIFAFVEVKGVNGWEHMTDNIFMLDKWGQERYKREKTNIPFNFRSYSLFGWLAGVRNYSNVKPLAEPRGLPPDVTKEVCSMGCGHHTSHFYLSELLEVDYDQIIEDCRGSVQIAPNVISGAYTLPKGQEKPLRTFLPQQYFDDLQAMGELDKPENIRVVFWFSG